MNNKNVLDEDEDFPTVGLTPFDLWFTSLKLAMISSEFMTVEEVFSIVSKEDWIDYYESGYTPQEAFDEDLTYYID